MRTLLALPVAICAGLALCTEAEAFNAYGVDLACVTTVAGHPPKEACVVEIRNKAVVAVKMTCQVPDEVAKKLIQDCRRMGPQKN
jgi:hypothetical protein